MNVGGARGPGSVSRATILPVTDAILPLAWHRHQPAAVESGGAQGAPTGVGVAMVSMVSISLVNST
jgi:hypothetical protein